MNRLAALRRHDAPVWTLADQALVSGSNFLVGVMLARLLGLQAFGAYVIAQTYLLYANTFQAALVVSPMMTAVPAEADPAQRRRLLQGFFAYMVAVLLLTALGVQALAAVLGHWVPTLALGSLAWPLAAAMAAFQTQDWLRRSLYVRSANRAVFLADLLAYGGQLAGLLALVAVGALSPGRALWVMAACFGVSSVVVVLRTQLWPHWGAATAVVRQHGRSSLDFLASWQLQWFGSSGVILIGSGFIGTQAAGAIKAVQNLLGPVNVFFQWMDNVVPVRATLRYRQGGARALAAYLARWNRLGLLGLGGATLLLLWIDDWLMLKLYGADYAPFAALVVFQALYYLFGHAYRMQSYYNRTLGQTPVLARASLFWAIGSVACALLTVLPWRERGIMVALVVGEVVALAYLLGTRTNARATFGDVGDGWWRLPLPGGRVLLLPIASRAAFSAALGMYVPSRWTGRLYKSVASLALPLAGRLGLLSPTIAPRLLSDCMADVLAVVPGARAARTGVLMGATAEHSKMTLSLMDDAGVALAFARVMPAELGAAAVHETAVLQALASSSLACQVPRLLAHGQAADGSVWLVESALSGGSSPMRLDARHVNFVRGLVRPNECAPWGRMVAELSTRLAAIPALARYRQTLDLLVSFWSAVPGPAPFPTCLEHGDFAPWNVRCDAQGQLQVIDWENACMDGIPWFDLIHFRHQVSKLVERQSPSATVQELMMLFDDPLCAPMRDACPLTEVWRARIVGVYLARALCDDLSKGWTAGDEVIAGRVGMILQLSEEAVT